MDQLADQITQAEREAHRDRPRDSLALLCAVLVAQHQAIMDLTSKWSLLMKRLEKLERDNPSW